ncbi:hypothetical protein RRG08_034851 [Elysia crispata]|uniref:Uncharacterized protein n=1 Tax=Elysia crispata TaxID=231223 RepID=A0AAE1E1M7_9GAST|nr:hypothetical protein RRG08_034851 [Elysia crispata]
MITWPKYGAKGNSAVIFVIKVVKINTSIVTQFGRSEDRKPVNLPAESSPTAIPGSGPSTVLPSSSITPGLIPFNYPLRQNAASTSAIR